MIHFRAVSMNRPAVPLARMAPLRAFAAAMAMALFLAFPAPAGAEIALNLGSEGYSWSEYEGGRKLLEESGNRYFLAFGFLQEGESGALFGYHGKVYAGDVAYDGQTQSGAPVTSTTGYGGMVNEVDLHYRLSGAVNYHFDILTGLGIDFWKRDIKGAYVPSLDASAAGYSEEYLIGYARLGVAVEHIGHGVQGALGVKLPVYTWEMAHLKGAMGADTDPVLEPGKILSYFAAVGYRFDNPWSLSLSYEGYRFAQSPKVPIAIGGTSYTVFQPESRQDIFMFSIGYTISLAADKIIGK
jgi:hypothetical protein